jgi:hypothetical protein
VAEPDEYVRLDLSGSLPGAETLGTVTGRVTP